MRIAGGCFTKRNFKFLMMALQKLCISVIVDEFERYYLAFYKSKDANLKRKFDFLLRVYSYQIAQLLFGEYLNRPEHYVDVLVNKYLTILDADWFSGCPWKTVTAKFAEMGSNLECIYFKKLHDKKRPWKDIICHLSNLERVEFNSDCNDEILKGIAKFCPNIVEINASDSRGVTDTGIKYLCMKKNGKLCCPKLKKINIGGFGVKEAGVAYLITHLPSLEETDYWVLPKVLYSLHKMDLSRLDKIEPYNITNLDLSDLYRKHYYTNILKICFSLCPHLKSLSCRMLEEEHLELFDGLNELEKLDVEGNSRSLDINNLLKLKGKKLTSLSINYCSLSLSNVVKSCPCLTYLYFKRVNFQNNSDNSPVFKRLKTYVSTPFLCQAAESASSVLEDITFDRCDISSNEFKAEFLKCCDSPIEGITISYSHVEMKFLKDILVNCYSLKYLTLDSCEDDLYSEKDELCRFAKALPNNPEIHILDYDDDDVNDDDYYYDDDDDDDSEDDDYIGY